MRLSTLFLTLTSVSGFGFNVNVPATNMGSQTVSSLFSSPIETDAPSPAEVPSPAAVSAETPAPVPVAETPAPVVAEESSAAVTETPAPAVSTEETPAPAVSAEASSAPATGTPPAAATNKPTLPTENNQPKYGKEMEMPGTYVRCGRCATSYAIAADDLGTGKGRRVECALCQHSWFQTHERLFTLNSGNELIPLPASEAERIGLNVRAGRDPDFIGASKFYVGNLDFGVQEEDLRKLFGELGPVGGASIVMGPDGRSKGFAFVTMMDEDMDEKCMKLDGHELKGRNINVNPANN